MTTDSAEAVDHTALGERESPAPPIERWVAWAIGIIGVLLAWWVSKGHMAASPDSVTYISAADSLRAGDGIGSWLESPLSTFPPLWPALIAGIPFVGTATSAFLWVGASILVVPRLALEVLRSVTTSSPARLIGLVAVALSPALLPWGYSGLSEVPFAAVMLISVVLAARSLRRPNLIWAAAAAAACAPLVRYAGVGVPLALAGWVLLDTRRPRRFLSAIGVGVIGLVPLAVVAAVNVEVSGNAMGGRAPSLLTPLQVAQQGVATVGRTALWTLDSAPQSISLVMGLAVIALTAFSVFGARRSSPPSGYQVRLLLGAMAVVQWVVLVAGRARVEMDDLDGRLLAPTVVLILLLGAALVGDLAVNPRRAIRALAVGAAVLWCLVGLGALGRGVANQTGGYYGDDFTAARSLPALEKIPADCRRVSVGEITDGALPACGILTNEPWAWYPSSIRPLMTPRKSATDENEDMARLRAAVEDGSDIYVAWSTVTEPYGSLVPLADLQQEFDMTLMGSDRDIKLFKIESGR